MEIRSSFTNAVSEKFALVYTDADRVEELEGRSVKVVHAYCFYKDKLVIVYNGAKRYWTPAGGVVEQGETPEQATVREVREESSMNVLKYALLGYQDID